MFLQLINDVSHQDELIDTFLFQGLPEMQSYDVIKGLIFRFLCLI